MARPLREKATSQARTDLVAVSKQTRWLSNTTPTHAAPTRAAKLPDGPARTRFAPSPTGHLHIGGLRTALFSYLLAKRTGGQFVLRIEDTDRKRRVEGAEARLYEDLAWAGLQWDEGPDVEGPYGPYTQSLRNGVYQKHALELLNAGEAYRCFCTPQTAGEAKAAYVTSGCYQNCSTLPPERSQEKAHDQKQLFTVRLRQPADAHKRVYPDLIYGKIQRLKRSPSTPLTASEDDTAVDASDTILVKSDGTPTYHFANVVDDHLMGITHVIRGSEWMASTPLHFDIYSAFDWKPPQFAHVGLLVDQNKAKLSKRNADLALDVASMRDKHGVLAAPLINFLALLGWSNPTTNDVMELDDLVRNFDLKFTRGNAMVRMEKLDFLQKAHVAQHCERAAETGDTEPLQPVVDQMVSQMTAAYPDGHVNQDLLAPKASNSSAPAAYATSILLADSKSFKNAAQFVERNRYFLAFDAAQVPAEQQFYNKAQTLAPSQLHDIACAAIQDEWIQPSPPSSSAVPYASIERRIHALLARESWRGALDTSTHPRLCSPPEHLSTESAVTSVQLPAGVGTMSPEAIAREIGGSDDARADMWLKRYKAVNGALMKYLREKLSLGLPGPHMSAVMAILGREECGRRLGVEDAKSKS